MSIAIQSELQDFTRDLLTATGGLVEWPEGEPLGEAMVTAEVAQLLQTRSESFALTVPPVSGGLSISLGGEFLDLATKLLEAKIPRLACFEFIERQPKKGDFEKMVEDAFSWNNVRIKFKQAMPASTEYHIWHFYGTLKADDVWEGLMTVCVNSRTLVPVNLPTIEHEVGLKPMAMAKDKVWQRTVKLAGELAQEKLLIEGEAFLLRTEQRRKRDHKRLRDYYGALRKEAGAVNKRTKLAPDPEDVANKERAVELELRRKLAEMDERYAIQGALTPLTLERLFLPTVAIDIAVQRKQAIQDYTIHWNPLLKSVEPLVCHRCRRGTYSPSFTNDTVLPCCPRCWEK